MSYMYRQYHENMKRFITFLLGNTKTIILAPILISFLISYGVLYDLTLKGLNLRIQWYFDSTLDASLAYDMMSLTSSSSASPWLASSATSTPLASLSTSHLHSNSFQEGLPLLTEKLDSLYWNTENDYSLHKITLSINPLYNNNHHNKGNIGSNALSYTFLSELNLFQNHLLHNTSEIVCIASPLQFWPIQFHDTHNNNNKNNNIHQNSKNHTGKESLNSTGSLTQEEYGKLIAKRQLYTDSLLRYLNSKSSVTLDGLFLNNIKKLNNLINYSYAINIYVITYNNHSSPIKSHDRFKSIANAVLNSHPSFIASILSTSEEKSIKDFIRLIIQESSTKYSYYSILCDIVAHSMVIITSIGFVGYVTLCILNQYKIRSKFGLCVGWFVEVVISCCGGILVMSWIRGKEWTTMYEPSTIIPKFSYVFMILLMSSNLMLNLISYLSGDNGFYEGENGLRIRLYKFFVGIDPLESPVVQPCGIRNNDSGHDCALDQCFPNNVFALQCEAICPTLCSYIAKSFNFAKSLIVVPLTARCYFVNLIVLAILKSASASIISGLYDPAVSEFFNEKVANFIYAIMIAITIDQVLHLTYLVCIVVIDLKRFELSDILTLTSTRKESNDYDTPSSSIGNNSEEVMGVNVFSSYLLKLSLPPHLRPSRSSYRHQVGQYLLKVKNPIPLCLRLGFNTCVEIGFLFATFISWSISMPHDLLNDDVHIYEELKVNSSSFDIFFYLELICILVIVMAMSGVLFKFSYSEIAHIMKMDAINTVDSLFVFEYESKKYFNSIDLYFKEGSTRGHRLDVLKIGTNSSSPFIVTIGLDHKVLIWSPLCKPEIPTPISASLIMGQYGKEFWPINHINISNDGNYIIIINFKFGLVKCYERKQLKYIWEIQLPENLFSSSKIKILESFFRRRTVPGYLTRKIHQQKKAARKLKMQDNGEIGSSRRDSVASLMSTDSSLSSLNGNYQAPLVVTDYMFNGIKEENSNSSSDTVNGIDTSKAAPNIIAARARAPSNNRSITPKDDFIFVLESGEIVTITCTDGSIKTANVLQSIYSADIGNSLRISSAKKLSTPRVNDRIICHLNNYDIVVAAMINNSFNIKKLTIRQGFYNIPLKLVSPMAATSMINETNDFKSVCEAPTPVNYSDQLNKYNFRTFSPNIDTLSDSSLSSSFQFNKSDIITVEFVGMIIRVRNLSAELIDIQTGVLLKTFSIGHFKPKSLKVSHLEPTHCKFCGCVSIQSFSICYEDNDSNTLILHTFRIDAKKLKSNICLRVERDPREIRCLGFSAVTEHQFWFDDIEKWELTDINVIIGIKKKDEYVKQRDSNVDTLISSNDSIMNNLTGVDRHFSTIVQETGLKSLRSRNLTINKLKDGSSSKSKSIFSKPLPTKIRDIWTGFIITANDGNLMNYEFPPENVSPMSLSISKPLCIEKFGYKSVAISFGNIVKVLYLGNDKLIEKDLYYSGTNTGLGSVLSDSDVNSKEVDNGLLFINKRRMHRERGRR